MTDTETRRAKTAEGIFQELEGEILRGEYLPNSLLPSIRQLAIDRKVSPATVASAFRKLAERGYTYSERGVGTKVRRDSLISESVGVSSGLTFDGIVDVASGAPDPDFLPDINSRLRQIQIPKALYGVEPVLPELRSLAASFMASAIADRDAHVSIASGALDGLVGAVEARLRPGARIIVEDPGFAATASLLRMRSMTLVPVPVDDFGFEPEPFSKALKNGVDAVLYSPRAQNPRGSTLSEERARALNSELMRSGERGGDVFVIENDHASLVSDVSYCSLTVSTKTWFSARSLSKSHGPDLRFAFVAGDELTIDRFERQHSLTRGWMSTILQHLVVGLLKDQQADELVQRARVEYSRRRQKLMLALAKYDIPSFGRSGLNVLVPVADEAEASNNLIASGWHVRSGQTYRHASGPFIRLTTAALSDSEIETLALHTARALRSSTKVYR